ncbi:MAG TPA: hypothetical protein VEJ36_02815 [Nitrososphaerales archaeon]|nr:hypothetical protein [Nitrososphaerales archaeon]
MQVLDSTLREGELFKVLNPVARVKLASRLGDAGFGRVELTVDYPPRTLRDEVRPVVSALKDRGVEVVMHGRAVKEDLDSMSAYDVEGCALYIAVSRLHREYKLRGISEDEALGRLCDGVEKARSLGFKYVRGTLEDASRIFVEGGEDGLNTLRESIARVVSAGATIVSIPDTSGLLTPNGASELFKSLRRGSRSSLSAHFHNDYGFASANTVGAALEGADELHTTIMGVGDRNGIADAYEVVAALEDVHGIDTGIERRSLKPLYNYFSRVAGVELPWRHPLSESARTVRAGVHQSMTVRRGDGYIPSQKLANDFGEPRFGVSEYISHNLIRAILSHHGPVTDEASRRVAERVATAAANGASSLDALMEIMSSETGIEVTREELSRYFGGQRFYVLLRLWPHYDAQEILDELSSWESVDAVDEVYGEADMVVRMRSEPGSGNPVAALRQAFPSAIQSVQVLVMEN